MEEQRAREEQGKLLAAAASDHNAEYDLLSRLPEHLTDRLLPFLLVQEIIKASAVCKSWRRIFSSFSVLDFRPSRFVGKGSCRPQDMRGQFQRMVTFVDATMTRFREQHLKIDKFRIDYSYYGELTGDCLSQIDKWIDIALGNNAEEIHIALLDLERDNYRTLPEPPSLDLGDLPGSTNLKSLRSLTLDGFRAGEFLTRGHLASAFGSLESLTIIRCRLKKVRISGLPNIKTVSITRCRSNRLVEIEAPSLESFRLDDFYFCRRTTDPCVVNVDDSPNLKSLSLESVEENDDWFPDFLSRFPLLRDLTLDRCCPLSRIRISNPLIENIEITRSPTLRDISIEAPQLRRFRLCASDRLLPSIQMEIPPRRQPVAEVDATFSGMLEYLLNFREFLLGSCRSFSSINFRTSTRDYVLELRKDIKYGWLGVVACNPQQLSLARRRATQEAVHRAVDGTGVNGHIWTPHPATLTAVAGLSDDGFLKLFFDKVTKCGRCYRLSREHCTSYINNADIKIVTGSNN